jgi:tetratricopeptide (TPR) repeat protein
LIRAIVHYRNALALSQGEAPLWNDLGRCFLAQGRFDEAVAAFRRALAIDPDLADAYRNLAGCRLLPADDPELARIAALAERTDLPIEERAAAGFAVAKALDDADRYDEAFAAYDSANRLYCASRAAAGDRFDAADLARKIDRLIVDFTPALFATVGGWGNPSDLPVFIVGLPRSGTSLVEQIAASHSRVFGAGELKTIGEAAAELGPVDAPWTQATVRHAADAHLERLNGLGGGADRVIDKLPDNIFMLGVIATLYPAARIIFCRRDPRDIGVSCFFQKFSAGLLTFSYDLADCGRRIRETERLTAHWHRVLPLRWLDIQYESLVADLEGESRRLIDFLGLAWEPACLDFHRTIRTVQTASSWQVRQPLYHRSVGRWRHYQRHLGPLLRNSG